LRVCDELHHYAFTTPCIRVFSGTRGISVGGVNGAYELPIPMFVKYKLMMQFP
jgi:hypothetical protein